MTDERRYLLVVEDDAALQLQMKWAFDTYDVVLASDREEAIARNRLTWRPLRSGFRPCERRGGPA